MFIHKWFEQTVDAHSSAIALSMEGSRLTYRELDERANQLAHALIASGVRPGDIVGVCLKRSTDLIAGVLAILKTGAAYLPLDPEYPVDRLKYMVTHSQVIVILNNVEYNSIFNDCSAKKIVLDEIDFSSLSSTRSEVSTENINLGYVIYTSGSTGFPKGVCLGHTALVNLIQWQNKQSRDLENLITLQFTPLSFDVHFQEIFSTLTSGGELILINEGMRLNPVQLLKKILENNIGRIFLPYVALNQLAETAVKLNMMPDCLKEVTTAGEQLKITPAIREFFKNLNDAILYNHYGPSETHVVTSQTLAGDPDLWPILPAIGTAIDNCEILILDENMNQVSKGTEGDLFIAGVCLADGYLNSNDLTSERFLGNKSYGRIYKTGDTAVENSDGSIQFLGRKDGQVKIRGYRVEVGEIEVALQNCKGITQSAVNIIEIENEKSICAYFVGNVDLNILRNKLREELPEYMVPSRLIKLETLPLTPSGKVDYKSLPLPSKQRPELMNEFVAPESDIEELMAKIWRKHLVLDQIGVLDNFFDLGGNSLLAIRIMIETNQALNKEVSVVEFFQAPTIKQLCSAFTDESASEEVYFAKTQGSLTGDIAVIGVAGRFPGADSVKEFWSNLVSGKVSTEKFETSEVNSSVPDELRNDSNYVFVQGAFPEQKTFDYKFFGMTPREAELMDPQQRKFLELSVEALEEAGYFAENLKEVVGVFAGMGNSKYSRLVDQHPEKVAQAGEFNVMLGLEKDYIATRVSHKLNLTGPSLSIHTGCSTSLVAIIEAVKSLRAGDCTMALAGGISISGAPNTGHLYQEGGILTQDGLCRPFDENATGTVFSDGAGIVVLKKLEAAIRNGDNILGVIKGVGINNDGADKMSFTAPSSKGQADAIRRAHLDAEVDARTISYVEAHGTATPVGDPIEVQALKKAFEYNTKDKNFCYLSSIKANVGHLTAAAGVAGFIKALLVVNKGVVPPTANFSKPNKLLNLAESPFIVSADKATLAASNHPRRAGVSSFGVGGTNSHVIIEQYVPAAELLKGASEAQKNIEPTLFKISAKSQEQVNEIEKNLIAALNDSDISEWRKIAYTLEVGRKDFSHRKFLVLKSKDDLAKLLPTSKGYNQFKKADALHMMFPGQGSQYICMGKGLFETSMVFRSELERCSDLLEKITGYSIKNIIFDEANAEKLNNTFYTQPAMFVIEYSLGKMMIELGYKPKGFIGHSIGEYVAATLAGIFSLEDGLKVIAKRAELMTALPAGMMLSVASTAAEVESLLKTYTLDIAAINGANSVVVAGTQNEVERFKVDLEQLGVGSVILKTSHAFHSRMMEPVVEEFTNFLDTIQKNAPKVSILSTVSLKRDDSDLQSSRYWAEHLVKSVQFAPAMAQLLNEENVLLMEVGPKTTLSNLSRKQALVNGQKNVKIFSLLSDNFTLETHSIVKAIGELWSAGFKLKDAKILFKKEEQKRTSAPTYVFEKNTVWLETKSTSIKTEIRNKIPEISMSGLKKEQLTKNLIEIFEKSSGIEVSEFGNDTCFLEMGMDSLFLTQISLQLKKELKIQVTFRQLLEEYSSINLLADAFVDKVSIEVPQEAPIAIPVSAPVEQIQIQQRSQTPVIESMVSQKSEISGTAIEQIVQRQLDLMNQQMLLLRNVKVSAPEVAVAKPVAATPAKVEVKAEAKTRGADIKTAKDSFGAAAKINIEKNTKFTDLQNKMIQNFFTQYTNKTKLSKKFTQDHRKTHADPRVVTGFKPENKEIVYPVVVKKSEQQYLWDLDDNKYIDMTCGFGSNFFGNGNERIKKLVLKQLEEGIELGPQHPLVGEVSKLICDLTGNDRAAFCNTGSEAVLGAMRLARTVTGREKIVVFSGSYHGINDEVIIRSAREKSYPAAPGINGNAVSNMIVLEYGTEETLNIIRSMAGDLAAVLVEPVQSRRCNFHPVEFLKEVRKITTASETCLIFDEIITGFRVHPAGAQGHFGIRADLCTYGKVVGGGMPIGVISGKTEYMDALDGGHWNFGDETTPTVGVTYFAGTFVRHPLALAAAKGALEILRDGGVKMLTDLNNRTQKFVDDLNNYCKEANVPFEMHNFGSLMKPKWKSDVLGGELLFAILRYNGVHVYDGFPWFINLAHTENDINNVLETIKDSIVLMQTMGLLPDSVVVKNNKTAVFNQNQAPRPGAKLGRDESGNPAWFMENPSKAGEYYLIEE